MYRKFLKSIEKIKAFHDLDRVENPGAVPAEIDIPVIDSIRRHCFEDRRRYSDGFANLVFEHLVEKAIIVKSPYGGHMFPYVGDLPSEEEVRDRVQKVMNRIYGVNS